MVTTRTDIVNWLAIGNKENHSHMIVFTDTYEDYPVFVARGTDIQDALKEQKAKPMAKVIEVYSYDQPLEPQIAEHRAWNL